jgi:hypothetical protein
MGAHQVKNFGPQNPFPHKWPPPLGSFSADPNRHRPSLLRTALPIACPSAASLLPAPDMEELLPDSGNARWVEPDPDDLAFPGRDRAALWSDLSSDGEPPEVEAPVPVEWATEEAVAAPAEVEGAVAKGEERHRTLRPQQIPRHNVCIPRHNVCICQIQFLDLA